MVIKFTKYRGAEMSAVDKKFYESQLKNIGNLHNKLSRLNLCYNNLEHGVDCQFDDILRFLVEIQRVASSKVHTLEIFGSEHLDPSYRTSNYVWTSNNRKSQPALIKDIYITFSVRLSPSNVNSVSRSSYLTPGAKYHLLVSLPIVSPTSNLGYMYYKCIP